MDSSELSKSLDLELLTKNWSKELEYSDSWSDWHTLADAELTIGAIGSGAVEALGAIRAIRAGAIDEELEQRIEVFGPLKRLARTC